MFFASRWGRAGWRADVRASAVEQFQQRAKGESEEAVPNVVQDQLCEDLPDNRSECYRAVITQTVHRRLLSHEVVDLKDVGMTVWSSEMQSNAFFALPAGLRQSLLARPRSVSVCWD